VVELADTHALGACGEIPRGGSSPLFGILHIYNTKSMIKKIIRPFQEVLLEKRLCAGCTYPLDKTKKIGNLSERRILVQCKCNRRYVLDKESNTYERATFAEEQQILKELEKGRSL
jgi:hypothetical protein